MADNIRPARVFDTNYRDDIALNRTTGDRWRVYGGFLLLLLIPILTTNSLIGSALGIGIPPVWISIINSIAIFIIAAQGLNILIGYAGKFRLDMRHLWQLGLIARHYWRRVLKLVQQ